VGEAFTVYSFIWTAITATAPLRDSRGEETECCKAKLYHGQLQPQPPNAVVKPVNDKSSDDHPPLTPFGRSPQNTEEF
jgi:hypothetical protein